MSVVYWVDVSCAAIMKCAKVNLYLDSNALKCENELNSEFPNENNRASF